MMNDSDYYLVSTRSASPVNILTRRRIENGRMRDDNGFLHWNAISDFYLPKYYKGRESEVQARLDNYRSVGRNGVRVFCSVANSDGNYLFEEERMDWVYQELIRRGLYPEFCLFADAQKNYPLFRQRVDAIQRFASFCRDRLILPQIVNEAFKNGFSSAVDEDLIDLSLHFKQLYGSASFSVSDSIDDSTGSLEIYKILAEISNILVLHPDRLTTDDPWRWVNHLKGFTDTIAECRKINLNIYGIHDEPKGAASTNSPSRDSVPNHHIAANFVANCCCIGYTGHYIPEQDPSFPGLDDMRFANMVSADPSFTFKNAGTEGSAVKAFSGYTKVRVCDNGKEAYAVGYGGNGTIVWDGYGDVKDIYRNDEVGLFHAFR